MSDQGDKAASPAPADAPADAPTKSGNDAAASFLKDVTGAPVVIKLASGIEYHGLLQAVDGFMNITLKETKEVYDGKEIADFGDVFLRGSMVTYIAAA